MDPEVLREMVARAPPPADPPPPKSEADLVADVFAASCELASVFKRLLQGETVADPWAWIQRWEQASDAWVKRPTDFHYHDEMCAECGQPMRLDEATTVSDVRRHDLCHLTHRVAQLEAENRALRAGGMSTPSP